MSEKKILVAKIVSSGGPSYAVKALLRGHTYPDLVDQASMTIGNGRITFDRPTVVRDSNYNVFDATSLPYPQGDQEFKLQCNSMNYTNGWIILRKSPKDSVYELPRLHEEQFKHYT